MAVDLLELAARVSGGNEIDWDDVERRAPEAADRRVVRHLRLIESIARVHGLGPAGSDPSGAAATATRIAAGEGVAAEPLKGRRWAHLELRAQLGEGAFGEVYRALDSRLEREVALKLLKVPAGGDQNQLVQRILREGRLLARVRHPNVVVVHGVEAHDGRVGLWMEYIDGRSLEDLLCEQGALSAREAALVGIDLCRALAAVHGAGLVHRDVKAANVMREQGGRIVLMDFGTGLETASGGGEISGTPCYIAPEVWEGAAASPTADIFSLGVLLHHLLTGSYPIQAANPSELKAKLRRREMRLLRDQRPDLPEALLRAVERALEWDPAARFVTAGEMERALSATLGVEAAPVDVPSPRPRVRRRATWLAAAALVVVAVAVVWIVEYGRGTTAAPEPYSVEAGLVRVSKDAERDRLAPGDGVEVGDRLMLEFEGSRDLYVYVMNRDERGRAFVLFPLPGLAIQNPLPGGVLHRIPGSDGSRALYWEVTSAGGREHVMILASPERQVELEAELGRLPRPARGELAQPLPSDTEVRLRGIGGLAEGDPVAPLEAPADRLFDLAESLAGGAEVTRGVWLRRIELDSSSPSDANRVRSGDRNSER